MTYRIDRIRHSVALLAIFAVFALAGVPSSRLAAQAAGAGTTQQTAAVNQNDRWESAIRKFEDADRGTPPPQNAIVFVGASSIVRWNLPESFPELGPQAINRGFGGSLAIGADGKPRKELLVEDGLHMTPAGYKIWNDALRPLLQLSRSSQ